METTPSDRFEACPILWEAGITCIIWAEDALGSFGIPTGVNDVFLLVNDPPAAAQALRLSGMRDMPVNPMYKHIPQLSTEVIRLAHLPSSIVPTEDVNVVAGMVRPAVVLLSAKRWHYSLSSTVTDRDTYWPDMASTLNSLMATWMSLTEQDQGLIGHLGILMGYFYLYLEATQADDFANQLSREHRQLHFDLLVEDGFEAAVDSPVCQAYHRSIREQILRGDHVPAKAAKPILPVDEY